MFKILLVLAVTIARSCVSLAQRSKSVLLSGDEAKRLAQPCSRPGPKDITDTSEPDKKQILEMESRLSDIAELMVKSCCIVGIHVKNPNEYYMQYAPLIVGGEKIIYVSGMSTEKPEYKMVDSKTGAILADWTTRAVEICDGGESWGVIYNVRNRKFSDLAVNGVG